MLESTSSDWRTKGTAFELAESRNVRKLVSMMSDIECPKEQSDILFKCFCTGALPRTARARARYGDTNPRQLMRASGPTSSLVQTPARATGIGRENVCS